MRIASFGILIAAGTALSGCDASKLDAVANLGTSCTSSAQSLNCGAPAGTGTATPTPTTTSTTPPNTNVGNTAAIVTGDTTLIVDNGSLSSTPTNMGISKLTLVAGTAATATTAATPNTAKIAITTNTATNGNWPIAKTMDEYTLGTAIGSGLGGTYKEYRTVNKVPGSSNAVDEELQVWTWQAGSGTTFATQYRDVTSGGNPATHQAWSFGGNYTTAAAMPTTGSATYTGRFGGIAVTSNFIDDPNTPQTLSRNNRWSVTGDTNITANFGTNGTINGTLTPTEWHAWQTLNGIIGFRSVYDPATLTPLPPGATQLQIARRQSDIANWYPAFMATPVQLNGTIKTNATTTGNTKPNTVTGVAAYSASSGWLNTTSNSFFSAGFFGDNAEDITGAFSVDAQIPEPIGGLRPINDDRRGFISMQGIFNGCKIGSVC
jgi:C-lobe and N-lobe beta barrels of Tf-binding protein B